MRSLRYFRFARFDTRLLFVPVIALCVLTWRQLDTPSKSEFHLHRSHYEALVKQVKAAQLPVGVHRFLWKGDVLRPLHGNTDTMEGRVTVLRMEEERDQITLITSDQGHAGIYGYIYSDAPLARRTDDAYRNIDTPGDLVFLREAIAPHWYSAYNNLY